MSTLYGRLRATRDGLRALSIGRLKYSALKLLHSALEQSELNQSQLAERLGVRKSAVNGILKGDGNVRISTLADYLHALGFEAEMTLVPAGKPREDAVRAMNNAQKQATRAVTLPVVTEAQRSLWLRYAAGHGPIGSPWTSPSHESEHRGFFVALSSFGELPLEAFREAFRAASEGHHAPHAGERVS